MTTESLRLFANFEESFTLTVANTPAQKDRIYQLRYRVYCEEFQYVPAQHFLDKREVDEFDQHSLHCLISHKNNDMSAACARLVMATENNLLPFEKQCAGNLDQVVIAGLNLNRQTVSEISRVAVATEFRRRAGETASRFGDVLDFSDIDKRTCSLLAFAAFFAAIALTELTGRTNLFALLEPFFVKLLTGYGITLQKVGKEGDYHGIRAPYFFTTGAILDAMNPEIQRFYVWVKNQVVISN